MRRKEAIKSWELILRQFPDAHIEHRNFAVVDLPNGKYFHFRLGAENDGWANFYIEVEYRLSETEEVKILDDELLESIKNGDNTRFPPGSDRALLDAAGYEIGSSWLNIAKNKSHKFLKVKIREPLTMHRLEGQLQLSVLLGDAHFADLAYQARRHLEKTPKRPSGSKPSFWNFSDFGWFLVYYWNEKVWKKDIGNK
jgi:hypothetical protein